MRRVGLKLTRRNIKSFSVLIEWEYIFTYLFICLLIPSFRGISDVLPVKKPRLESIFSFKSVALRQGKGKVL